MHLKNYNKPRKNQPKIVFSPPGLGCGFLVAYPSPISNFTLADAASPLTDGLVWKSERFGAIARLSSRSNVQYL